MRTKTTITRLFLALLTAAACFSCGSGKSDSSDIQDSFLGAVHLGDQKHDALAALYAQHFVDAASGEADSHFDTIPLEGTDYSELKILAMPTDTAGFTFLGKRWLNLQIEFDGGGLYCVTFRAKAAAKNSASEQFAAILQSLQKSYPMQRMVIGHSTAEGEATDIVGYRHESGGRMVQLYLNELPDGTAAPVLSYIANKPTPQ